MALHLAALDIDKCVIVDLSDGVEKDTGYSATGWEVKFRGHAACDCQGHDVEYVWTFEDTTWSAQGAEVTHRFPDLPNDGTRIVTLTATCKDGCGTAQQTLELHVISGIRIDHVGVDGKLCFDGETEVQAAAEPWEDLPLEAHDLIDFWQYLYVKDAKNVGIEALDAGSTTDLVLPADKWPTKNWQWGGTKQFEASIDDLERTGQDGLDLVNKIEAEIVASEWVYIYFEKYGTQNPEGAPTPNWYYYWASDMGGPLPHAVKRKTRLFGSTIIWEYDPAVGYGQSDWPGKNGRGPNEFLVKLGRNAARAENRDWKNPAFPPPGKRADRSFPAGKIAVKFSEPEEDGTDKVMRVIHHEGSHITHYKTRTTIADRDRDWLSDAVEDALGTYYKHRGTYSSRLYPTPGDFFYINGNDDEIQAELDQIAVNPNVPADDDWAHPGKQWP